MDLNQRINSTLDDALSDDALTDSPDGLRKALRYAVFPGGARVRPRLCLSVALACGDDYPEFTNSIAAAIELLHCASLVHDDMPAFDGSAMRRGKPSVHMQFGEPLALLTGDALIVMAFQVLAKGAQNIPSRLGAAMTTIANGVGAPTGIVAGQAWECESDIPLDKYQQAKTGALFAACTMGGAVAAGADPGPWRVLGESIGHAYQVADDLLDANGDPAIMGKPAGKDQELNRPSAVLENGQKHSVDALRNLVSQAVNSIPSCPGEKELRQLIARESEQFVRQALNCRVAA